MANFMKRSMPKGGKSTFAPSKGRKGTNEEQARTRRMLFKLRLEIKRMEKNQKKLEFQAEKSKKRAIELRQNGDEQGAKLHAGEMLKYRKMAANMVKFVTNMQAMQYKLEQVTETQRMSDMFQSIDTSLKSMKETTLNVPEIQSTLDSINNTITELDMNMEVTQEGLQLTTDAQVSGNDLDEAMEEIDTSIAMDGMDLPTAANSPVEDEKIKDYKSRIDSLRG